MASITHDDSSLKLRTVSGELSSGADQITTYSFDGVDESADASVLKNMADAIASVLSYPVQKVLRVDTNIVSD